MNNSPVVFVVDDDQAAAASVAALMNTLKLQTVVFHSAEDFLKALDGSAQSATDDPAKGCLILDIRLPGMSGHQLRDELLKRGWNVPTIFISGDAEPKCCEQLLREGAVACLEKPYSGEQLCAAVQSVLKQA